MTGLSPLLHQTPRDLDQMGMGGVAESKFLEGSRIAVTYKLILFLDPKAEIVKVSGIIGK